MEENIDYSYKFIQNEKYEKNKWKNNGKKGITVLELLYIILIYLLIFQNFLQNYIHILQYLDEFIAMIGIGTGILSLKKNNYKIKKMNLIILSYLTLITIIGFYSVFRYKYQKLIYSTVDWIIIMKFFSTFFLGQTVFKNINKSKKINANIKIITIFLFLLTIANYVFNLYDGEIRYGIKANRLFFEHQTYLAAACIALLANFIFFSQKINKIYIYMLIFIIISTIRLKAIGGAIASIIILLYVSKTNKKITLSKLGVIALICILVAYNQIYYYFIGSDEFARGALTTKSIEIANDYFPIGTGFGTYGSFISGENYSPVYSIYGLNNIFGLKKGEASFLSDTFWPMILGQFGYLGTLCYIICLIVIFKKIQLNYNVENKQIYIAQLICFSYLIISSTSESSFSNPIAIPLAMIIGM